MIALLPTIRALRECIFYSQTERKFAVVPVVVLSASLIMRCKMQGYGSPFAFLPGQTGCQNHCLEGTTVFFRIDNSAVVYLLLLLLLSACDKVKQQVPGKGDLFPRKELSKLMSTKDAGLDLTTKTLVINFWASWCVPCREEMATLQQLSDAMDKKHYLVVGVSIDEDINLMREFLYQYRIRFDNYQDKDQFLADKLLGVRAYPETFIVSPQGVIMRRIAGQQDWNSPSVHLLLESIHSGKNTVQSLGGADSISKKNHILNLLRDDKYG